jgi:hypothetical protein
MRIRPIYAISSLALVLVLCGITWKAFRPKNREPVKIYKAVSPGSPTVDTSQAPQSAQTAHPEKEALTSEERAERSKDFTLEAVRILRGTETDPFMEKLQKAMETPEYQEYVRKQQETFGVDLSLWWDFLESQGLGSGRSLQDRDFTALFPGGGESNDYEPYMRKKFAELVLENPFKDTGSLLSEFWQDEANYIWTRQHFNGHVGDYDWAENIRQNAGSILAEFTAVETETAPPTPTPGVAEKTRGSQLPTRQETGIPTETSEQKLRLFLERETALTPDISADIPNLPNNGGFEKALRGQFSPERFNTAVQTLTQYGPEEGLRKLKESDPEIAFHVERLIQTTAETD